MFSQHVKPSIKCLTLAISLAMALLFTQAAIATSDAPQTIPADQSCGKCGMYPAKYPEWQAQIVFKDGSMTPFDGCKCMFGFMFKMGEYDKAHTKDDIAKIWAKDFITGEWVDAKSAHFVIGSNMMGPMGKELIPFKEAGSAETFQKEHGGHLASFDAVNMDTLKPLMHKKHMEGHMNNNHGHQAMEGHMNMDGHQNMQGHHMDK